MGFPRITCIWPQGNHFLLRFQEMPETVGSRHGLQMLEGWTGKQSCERLLDPVDRVVVEALTLGWKWLQKGSKRAFQAGEILKGEEVERQTLCGARIKGRKLRLIEPLLCSSHWGGYGRGVNMHGPSPEGHRA